LESRILEISYSGSPSISRGGGGDWVWFGITFGVVGWSMEMWKMGWTACMESGSQSVRNECPVE
jgi:hypothetical protein